MKNLTKVILLTLFCSITSNIYSDVVYRLANKRDIPQLLELQKTIAQSTDDRGKLVVFPEHKRESILNETIARGRLFVATEDRNIISFLKLYIIDNGSHELTELLCDELRCCGENINDIELASFNKFTSQTDEPIFSPMHNSDSFDESIACFQVRQKQTFLYYGGAYTIPGKRGRRHGTLLLRNAFGMIRARVIENIKINSSNELVLTYGQVLENQNNTLMRREFVKEIPQIHNSLTTPAPREVLVYQYAYVACMPAFTEEMRMLPDSDEREGRGNLIVYHLPVRDLTVSQ